MKQLLSLVITALCAAGAYFIANTYYSNNLILIVLSTAGGILIFVVYNMLWINEMDSIEQDLLNNRLREDRIPVIGGKRINWDEYRNIPSIDKNTPITFDRNKL